MKPTTGVRARHARACLTARDKSAACKCSPSYEASVYLARDGVKVRAA